MPPVSRAERLLFHRKYHSDDDDDRIDYNDYAEEDYLNNNASGEYQAFFFLFIGKLIFLNVFLIKINLTSEKQKNHSQYKNIV